MNKLIEKLGRMSDLSAADPYMADLLDDAIKALEAADHVMDMWDTGTSRDILDAVDAYRQATGAVSDRFCLGSTYAQQLCRRFGFDPFEFVSNRP